MAAREIATDKQIGLELDLQSPPFRAHKPSSFAVNTIILSPTQRISISSRLIVAGTNIAFIQYLTNDLPFAICSNRKSVIINPSDGKDLVVCEPGRPLVVVRAEASLTGENSNVRADFVISQGTGYGALIDLQSFVETALIKKAQISWLPGDSSVLRATTTNSTLDLRLSERSVHTIDNIKSLHLKSAKGSIEIIRDPDASSFDFRDWNSSTKIAEVEHLPTSVDNISQKHLELIQLILKNGLDERHFDRAAILKRILQ